MTHVPSQISCIRCICATLALSANYIQCSFVLVLQNEIQRWKSNTARNIGCFPMVTVAITISTRNSRYRRTTMQRGRMSCLSATCLQTSAVIWSTVIVDIVARLASTRPVNMITTTALITTPAVMINMNRRNSSRFWLCLFSRHSVFLCYTSTLLLVRQLAEQSLFYNH